MVHTLILYAKYKNNACGSYIIVSEIRINVFVIYLKWWKYLIEENLISMFISNNYCHTENFMTLNYRHNSESETTNWQWNREN